MCICDITGVKKIFLPAVRENRRPAVLRDPARLPAAGAELTAVDDAVVLVAGHQRSAQFAGPVNGFLSGDLVQLSFTSRYEGSTICYFLDGQIRDGAMSGTAVLGAASDQNHGIVNRSQFGTGRWQASRVA